VLGLGDYSAAFEARGTGWAGGLGRRRRRGEVAPPPAQANKLQGDVIFLLLESHLQDLGMRKVGDRRRASAVG